MYDLSVPMDSPYLRFKVTKVWLIADSRVKPAMMYHLSISSMCLLVLPVMVAPSLRVSYLLIKLLISHSAFRNSLIFSILFFPFLKRRIAAVPKPKTQRKLPAWMSILPRSSMGQTSSQSHHHWNFLSLGTVPNLPDPRQQRAPRELTPKLT